MATTKSKPAIAGANGMKSQKVQAGAAMLTCTLVNGMDASSGQVTLDSATYIDVCGTGLPGKIAQFTLVGRSPIVRGAKGQSNGNWEIRFPTDGSATYYLTCEHDMDPPQVKILVTKPALTTAQSKPGAVRIVPCLALNPPDSVPNPAASAMFVAASGTVINGQDAVTCTLTPINNDGTTDATRPGPQTLAATMNGNAWTVMFTPAPTLPPNPPAAYGGLYLFEATAANEGAIYATLDI